MYEIPAFMLLLLLMMSIGLISSGGLYVINLLTLNKKGFAEANVVITIYIGFMAAILGLFLSFLIIGVWESYNRAISTVDSEAETIYILYGIVSNMAGTEETKQHIIKYLEYIINVELPSLLKKEIPEQGKQYIKILREDIYSHSIQSVEEKILYSKSIELYDKLVTLRIERLTSVKKGLPKEIWAVLIIGIIVLIVMSWFIVGNSFYNYILNGLLGIYLGACLFAIIILEYPFSTQLAIKPDQFKIALYNILNNI